MRGLDRGRGQANLKPGIARNRGHIDGSSMLTHDSKRRIQPQPCSFSHFLSREEWFEDTWLNLRRNTGP